MWGRPKITANGSQIAAGGAFQHSLCYEEQSLI